MKQIIVFCLITLLATSCGKKVVAPFAPTTVAPQSTAPVISEGEKQRLMNEVLPTNNQNKPEPHHVPQQSIEATLPAMAAPAPKLDREISASHVDRILDQSPVERALVKKASYKKAVSGPRNWAPQLKIGLTLLGIGVLLAIFGLGFVGGLSALIGLLFTIVGLLVTY